MKTKEKFTKRFKFVILTLMAFLLMLSFIIVYAQLDVTEKPTTIIIYPDSVLSIVSHHPIGINLNYLMDDDNYLKPERKNSDALKAMGVKYLRYPGGNKSDSYFFSSPPYAKSEPTLARTGPDATGGRGRMLIDYKEFKFDVLDFDEFIEMCRETNSEPIIVVAADEYLVDYPVGNLSSTRKQLIDHAVEWVRYSNVTKKYNVKYWMIGNESWHGQNMNSTAEIYARDVVDFSRAMKEVDSSIYIIPNGNSVEFCETVLEVAGDYIDLFTISNYPVYNYRAGYATYRDTLQDLMGPVKRALTAMNNIGVSDDMKLIIAEYGSFDWGRKWPFINNMGSNLANFEMTGDQLLEPRIKFSCFWNTRWIHNDSLENSAFDALDKNGNFNANGLGLMIWGNYLGDKMVRTTGTVHIRSFASYSPLKGYIYVYLLNKAEKTIPVNLPIQDYEVDAVEMYARLGSTGPDDVDPVWEENIPITKRDLKRLELPGVSISILKIKLI